MLEFITEKKTISFLSNHCVTWIRIHSGHSYNNNNDDDEKIHLIDITVEM